MKLFIDDNPRKLNGERGLSSAPNKALPPPWADAEPKDGEYHMIENVRQQTNIPTFLGPRDLLPVSIELDLAGKSQDTPNVGQFNWLFNLRTNTSPLCGTTIVTLPLPKQTWSNPETWIGLCNLLSAKCTAPTTDSQGLRMNVWLADVPSPMLDDDLQMLPGCPEGLRERFFSLVVRRVFAVLPEDLKRSVYGPPRSYCQLDPSRQNAWLRDMLKDGVSLWDFYFAVWNGMKEAANGIESAVHSAITNLPPHAVKGTFGRLAGRMAMTVLNKTVPDEMGLEVNTQPLTAVEFRRGRATLDPNRILRAATMSYRLCAMVDEWFTDHPDTGIELDNIVEQLTKE